MPSLRKTMRLKKSSIKSRKMRGGLFNMCKKYKDELTVLQGEYKGYVEWVNRHIQIDPDGAVSLKEQNESHDKDLYPTLASINSDTSQTYSIMKPASLSGNVTKGSDISIKRYNKAPPEQSQEQQSFLRTSLTRSSNRFPVDTITRNDALRKINNSSKNSLTRTSKYMRFNKSAIKHRLSEINNSGNNSLTRPPNMY